jgi:uncharacterized protein
MARKRVAILGASADRAKFGNKAVRAHVRAGWDVIPVNPRGGMIEGLPVATSAAELPAGLDRVAFYLPPDRGLAQLDALAALRPAELFLNPGTASAELLAAAAARGLRVTQGCSIIDVGFEPGDFP